MVIFDVKILPKKVRLTHDLELKVNQVWPSSNVESHIWRIQCIFVKFVEGTVVLSSFVGLFLCF